MTVARASALAGAGAVSPWGWGLAPLFAGISANARVLHRPRRLAGRGVDDLWVGEAPDPPAQIVAHLPDPRRMARISTFAWAAGREALQAADLLPAPSTRDSSIALLLTTTHGAAEQTLQFAGQLQREGPASASPTLFTTSVYNAPASHLALGLGLTGPAHTLIADADGWERLLGLVPTLLGAPGVRAVLGVAAAEVEATVIDAYRRSGNPGPFSEGAAAAVIVRPGPHPAPSRAEVDRIRDLCGDAIAATSAWAWILQQAGRFGGVT